MADTIELIGTLEDYRSRVEELNTALDSLDKSSQEYANTLSQLQDLNREWAQSLGTTTEKTEELKIASNETSQEASTGFKAIGTAAMAAIPGVNSLHASWKAFQTSLMTNPWVAVLTVALAGIVTLFNSLKKAVSSNEETSQKWKKAMATLQPVINMVKNALDKLAAVLVDVFAWVMEKTPGMLKTVGRGVSSVLNFIANIVDAITWIPRQLASMWQKVIPLVTNGVSTVLKPVKALFDAIGLEEWSRKINSALNSVGTTTAGWASSFANSLSGAGKTIRGLAGGVENSLNKISSMMVQSRDLQQKANEIDKETRTIQEGVAESYNKSAEAREKYNKAMVEGDTVEAQKQMKIMQDEIAKRAEMQVNLEQKRLSYMEEIATLTANSKKDNDDISKQRVKLIQAETQAQRELAMTHRLNARLQRELNKAIADGDKAAQKSINERIKNNAKMQKQAEDARKKELEAAEKAELEADKEAKKRSNEIVKQTSERIKGYAEEYKEFVNLETAKLNLLKTLNIERKTDDVKYENERYENEMKMYKKQFDEYIKLIDDANVLEVAKNKARQDLINLQTEIQTADIQHQINLAKIDAENLKKLANELQTKLKTETQRLSTEEQSRYNEELINLTERYKKGEISNRQYLERLEEIRKKHNENINNINIDQARREAENAKVIYDQMIQNVQDRYKDLDKIVEASEKELNNIIEEESSKAADDRDEERIRKAEQTYTTLKAIYEEGENGINDVINMLFTARSEMQSGDFNDSTNNLLQPIFDALKIDGEDLAADVDTALKMVAEVLGINLDDMLAKWQDYYAKKSEADTKANEDSANILKDSAHNAIKESDRQLKQFDKVSKQMSKTMSAVSNYWEQSIEQRLEAGEISQEQAEEEFERLKKFNIAQAVVDTISGALSAYMSVWKSPSLDLWAKIAMSVLMGAQTLASGYAQIRQIQSQTLSGASAGGSSATNVIVGAATPILSEAQDINNLNAMNAATEQDPSNTRVYVVESDITEAQNKTRVRVQESTF